MSGGVQDGLVLQLAGDTSDNRERPGQKQ